MFETDPRHVNNVVLVELGHEPNEPIDMAQNRPPMHEIGKHVDPVFTAANDAALQELGYNVE